MLPHSLQKAGGAAGPICFGLSTHDAFLMAVVLCMWGQGRRFIVGHIRISKDCTKQILHRSPMHCLPTQPRGQRGHSCPTPLHKILRREEHRRPAGDGWAWRGTSPPQGSSLGERPPVPQRRGPQAGLIAWCRWVGRHLPLQLAQRSGPRAGGGRRAQRVHIYAGGA
eukprot:gene6017-biopygen4306